LTAEQVKQHRAIAVGDTSHSLPTFSTGLLTGQETLTVPSLSAKLQAQLAGLGCGHLPIGLAAPYLATGALIEKQTQDMRPPLTKQIVWRSSGRGKCLKWFLNYLSNPDIQASLADG
jgi:DNA-binding transcriptional LysR family regulator